MKESFEQHELDWKNSERCIWIHISQTSTPQIQS